MKQNKGKKEKKEKKRKREKERKEQKNEKKNKRQKNNKRKKELQHEISTEIFSNFQRRRKEAQAVRQTRDKDSRGAFERIRVT